MINFSEIRKRLDDTHQFGVLAESNTTMLKVVAHNSDVAIGDLFLLPCNRGGQRFYLFRTTQYANIFHRIIEANDVARNKLLMPDSYLSRDLTEELLIELTGMVLGYAEWQEHSSSWQFRRPRRLPQHLSDVFHIKATEPLMTELVPLLMKDALGEGGLSLGELLAGERALAGVSVTMPAFAFSHHIGIFGRTGCGKSNLMMVMLERIFTHNRDRQPDENAISILAIDPHDEFRTWHSESGRRDGLRGLVKGLSPEEQQKLVDPFYYLTARKTEENSFEKTLRISKADITPDDLISITEFTEQQVFFSQNYYTRASHGDGEQWITRLLNGHVPAEDPENPAPQFHEGTIAAVQRRLSFLSRGQTKIFTPYDPDRGDEYISCLPEMICAMEQGRILLIDTSLFTELEQFLVSTIVARLLFQLRKALKSAESAETLDDEIRKALRNDVDNGVRGMQALADELCARLEDGRLPYKKDGQKVEVGKLPFVNVVIEEAPSILNPQRLRFGSVFRDISRQGRKFGIGLTVISQQVTEIDHGILTQLNTELTLSLGNEQERRAAIQNASADLQGFERELQVMSKGQVILTASYRDVPLPLQVPDYDLGDAQSPQGVALDESFVKPMVSS